MLKGSFTVQTGTVDIRTTDIVLRTPQKPAPVQGKSPPELSVELLQH